MDNEPGSMRAQGSKGLQQSRVEKFSIYFISSFSSSCAGELGFGDIFYKKTVTFLIIQFSKRRTNNYQGFKVNVNVIGVGSNQNLSSRHQFFFLFLHIFIKISSFYCVETNRIEIFDDRKTLCVKSQEMKGFAFVFSFSFPLRV